YIDLRTTEIPDEIPVAMALFGALWYGLAFLSGGSTVGLNGLAIGGAFFILGFLMYYTGQWGGGDAKLIAATGFLIPSAPAFAVRTFFPFPLSFLLNVFMIGAVYIVLYSFAVSLPNRSVTHAFVQDIRGGWKEIGLFGIVLAAVSIGVANMVGSTLSSRLTFLSLSLVPGGIGLFLLWRFLRIVERVGFRKKISVSRLRVGDMIGEDIRELKMSKKLIRGLTEEEIMAIRKIRRSIVIREGVRFGPAFPLALLYTLFFGDFVMLFSVV
ncbi:MAG: prepilin peptidase, partial [Candidatus Aenigmarchaeota archaeon]|nr:prepilin peptidase [Candidatus Aenigmarchaeota archaeon]